MEMYKMVDEYCIKCGGTDHDVEWHKSVGQAPLYDEQLDCYCRRCGYHWRRTPLDCVPKGQEPCLSPLSHEEIKRYVESKPQSEFWGRLKALVSRTHYRRW